MNITKQQLEQIIKEEIHQLLAEDAAAAAAAAAEAAAKKEFLRAKGHPGRDIDPKYLGIKTGGRARGGTMCPPENDACEASLSKAEGGETGVWDLGDVVVSRYPGEPPHVVSRTKETAEEKKLRIARVNAALAQQGIKNEWIRKEVSKVIAEKVTKNLVQRSRK